MVPILVLLTMIVFLVADWIDQMLKGRKALRAEGNPERSQEPGVLVTDMTPKVG